jgi:hypothetical protein
MTTLFERNEDCVTGFLKWTDFSKRNIFSHFMGPKGRLSYHLCVECFSQLSFDSEVYTKSATESLRSPHCLLQLVRTSKQVWPEILTFWTTFLGSLDHLQVGTQINSVQGVLALCEFHYCEFHYCGFSKLLLKFG